MKDNISSERHRNGATEDAPNINQKASSASPSSTCSASSLIGSVDGMDYEEMSRLWLHVTHVLARKCKTECEKEWSDWENLMRETESWKPRNPSLYMVARGFMELCDGRYDETLTWSKTFEGEIPEC